ncbi:MAG: hypothetical protein KJ057_13905 [Phycisphaerae bacterium]|nr:MAG: hypothetical protein EDS66_11285 [Planctomycetota bacterium]KAB2948195.1 MAG: hypothetical protein F9K17_06620 [Phycisphaerae bacterium]MBE7458480.1 hypothetical protein [Planctomycetia bacterium]MCK6465872.1 hypothetical protein [Phycisphaerae bacterium]MCL4719560.1 hypothetical protein [Phycisphaerae bacterium]
MNPFFPVNLPAPTAVYLALLILTWAMHYVLVSTVVAGSAYLALNEIFRRGDRALADPIARICRDWMPAALGVAITAGVAPLLVAQVIYQIESYTAHLLLWRRAALVLPALIAAFYLFYLQKSERFKSLNRAARVGVAVVAFLCVAGVGRFWAQVHVLTLSSAESLSLNLDAASFLDRTALVRFAVFGAATVLPWSAIVRAKLGPQLLSNTETAANHRCLFWIMCLGWAGVALIFAGASAWLRNEPQLFQALTSRASGPCLAASAAGMLIFPLTLRRGRTRKSERLCCSIQVVAVILLAVGLAGLRESVRAEFVLRPELLSRHAELAQKGGWAVFAVFAAVNAACILAAIQIARSQRERQE